MRSCPPHPVIACETMIEAKRNMDTVGACFINMVMDRLQALEGENMHQLAALRQENLQLKERVQQLTRMLSMCVP